MERSSFYSGIIRPPLFRFDPEAVHEQVLRAGALVSAIPGIENLLCRNFQVSHPSLEVEAFGLRFRNPIGLAAGFDKNCTAPQFLAALGFGHIELGTITNKPQEGNPKPRIFRLVDDRALINRMGFPSEGAAVLCRKLARLRAGRSSAVIGINFGRNKNTSIEDSAEDYLAVFKTLSGLGDYFVLNVSSPNTPELRKLQERDRLEALFNAIVSANTENKPLLVKIAPDLTDPEIDDILDVASSCKISGIIATNTTIGREGLSKASQETGGLSGLPLKQKSKRIVSYIYRRTEGKLPIIGVGGIETPEDAYSMIKAGASLVQVYTGFIYSGPKFVQRLSLGLMELMRRDGHSSIAQVKGQESSAGQR